MSFPLLQLPFIPLELILLNANLAELTHFSMISKKSYRLVNNLRIPYLQCLDLHVTKESTQIKFKTGKGYVGGWHFLDYTAGDDDEEDTLINRLIGNCEMKTFILENNIYSLTRDDVKESVRDGYEYLMDLFKVKVYRGYLYPDGVPMTRQPYFYPFKQIDIIYISGKKAMENEDFKKALNDTTAQLELVVSIPVNIDFQFEQFRIEAKYLSFYQFSFWIKSKMILNFDLKYLRLHECMMTPKDCQLFVIRWLHSDNTTFETTLLAPLITPEITDYQGLDLLPFDAERRKFGFKFNPSTYIDCTNGFDIIRHDGLLATIFIQGFYFIFHVWHDRFPDLEGLANFIK
ncbi:hypothetical protein GCK72_016791 [Caenorhabditis remanei]|uniref:F-box domain-containing protein n=1 Tax=Caenorhabditis remanei TaxID=31234 RepID=A0A6A5G6P8_CAERE|nr:hypothetical protein GCK72_016791 [Caenorhabditis remanei]KAF1750244.1 hypothetical protein GCK72_016791 [Caenorhabditis remanei]